MLITAPMADAESITDLLIDLRKNAIRVAEVSVQKPTLDEVFLTITGHDTKEKVEVADHE
jgi:ABC-2 type transport system ATP-binding protein